ncbi:MAG: glycosyltransferase [PVC group bacterium]|nr:glycosyltransferase [PVC group bacterium]
MGDGSVAVIIPAKRFNNKLNKCIERCLALDYPNYDIIVLPDESFQEFSDKIKVIPTDDIGPALKRDKVLEHSQAEFFAFLDDDAYPAVDWLRNAVRHFENSEVAAVCGPAVTPEDSSLLAKASGYVYSSFLATGKYAYRYIPTKIREVDDYPSCNFIIRRDVFDQMGGFDSVFFPGEDTKLCLDITKKLRKKIIYDPSILVFHHRRELWKPHLSQVANYALHRGYFAKRYPSTSLRIVYFIPSIFVICIIGGAIAALVNRTLGVFYLSAILVYMFLLISHTMLMLWSNENDESIINKIKLVILVTAGIVLTHISYGEYFIAGLLSIRLKEEVQ